MEFVWPTVPSWAPESSPQSSLWAQSRTKPFNGAILRAAGVTLTTVVSDHTYLKIILLIFAFTSCWVENESKGNSRWGVELNWNAPTLTCSRRQWAQGPETGVKSKTFLRGKKEQERLTTLPPTRSTNTNARAFSCLPGRKLQRPIWRTWKKNQPNLFVFCTDDPNSIFLTDLLLGSWTFWQCYWLSLWIFRAGSPLTFTNCLPAASAVLSSFMHYLI